MNGITYQATQFGCDVLLDGVHIGYVYRDDDGRWFNGYTLDGWATRHDAAADLARRHILRVRVR